MKRPGSRFKDFWNRTPDLFAYLRAAPSVRCSRRTIEGTACIEICRPQLTTEPFFETADAYAPVKGCHTSSFPHRIAQMIDLRLVIQLNRNALIFLPHQFEDLERPARFAPGSLCPVRYCARNRYIASFRRCTHREGDQFSFFAANFFSYSREGLAGGRSYAIRTPSFSFRIDASRE